MSRPMEAEGAGTKRKSDEAIDVEEASSPHRRAGAGVTIEAITAFFAKQTKEIKESTSVQIQDAIKTLEEKTLKRMDQSEENVAKLFKKQEGKIENLKKTTEDLMARVLKLEARPAASSTGSTAEGSERLALVVGGWKAETHRDLILSDFESLVKELDLKSWLDGGHFVPGIRNSVAIVPFVAREHEQEHQVRTRMSQVIQIVREARLQTQNLPENATVWAAVLRPRAARQPAAHAGKVRKCLYTLEVNARNSECEYSTGTVWLGSVLLASASRPKPSGEDILEGKLAGSWVDARAMANAVPCDVHRVREAWKKSMES